MVSLGSVLGCLWGAVALQLSSTTLQFGGPVGLIVLSIVSFFTPTIWAQNFGQIKFRVSAKTSLL